MTMDENPRPSKRARKSCERCRTRKQKCHGFPVCSNCEQAKEKCIQPPSAIEEFRTGPNQVLLQRISFLEAQLAQYTTVPKSEHVEALGVSPTIPTAAPDASEELPRKSSLADVVGFLSLGTGDSQYVGSSSGYPVASGLASSLGQMVQATVWNKALTASVGDHHQKALSFADVKKNAAGPPNDEMGARILDAYFTKTHHRYPFLDRVEIMKDHANRFNQDRISVEDRFGTFKLYMIYAIGATLLKLTEPYDYASPESFFMTALQYISAARESHSINNIQAMALLVIYNLRSPSNSGIWYMIGLSMRTCVDLGLHREAHYKNVTPYEGQLRRRLFWSVYFLERVIATSLGRPYSLADRDIDALLPLEIDDTVHDNGLIARTMAISSSTTFQASRPSSNLTLGIQCIRLMRLESYIQSTIYRVDRPVISLVSKINPILRRLEVWRNSTPNFGTSEKDYLDMHYYKAIRLLIQPFLTVLPPTDARIALCLYSSGQICQIFKRLHQRDSYGHSFIALHSVFIAGVTMCYTLFLLPSLWNFNVSNDLRACSTALFVMAERAPQVRKYRDALESVISATMEYMSSPNHSHNGPPPQSATHRGGFPGPTTSSTCTSDTPTSIPSPRTTNKGTPFAAPGTPNLDPALFAAQTAPSPRESFLRTTNGQRGDKSVINSPKQERPAAKPHQLTEQGSPRKNGSNDAFYVPWPPVEGYGDGSWGVGDVDVANAVEVEQNERRESNGGGAPQQVDAEWLLSLCEADGFSLQMLNDMLKFDQGAGEPAA